LSKAKALYAFFKVIRPQDRTMDVINADPSAEAMALLVTLRDKISKFDMNFTIESWFMITHLISCGYFYDRAFETFLVYMRNQTQDKLTADAYDEVKGEENERKRVAKCIGKAKFIAHYYRLQLEQHKPRCQRVIYNDYEASIYNQMYDIYMGEEKEDEKILKSIKAKDEELDLTSRAKIKEWLKVAAAVEYTDEDQAALLTNQNLKELIQSW